MPEGFAIVDPEAVPQESFTTCEVSHRKLTAALGCTELRVNQVLLDPGEVTTPHAHDGQEELFVAVTDGRISIEGETYDVPAGGVVRVAPEPIRSLRNDTEDARQVWLAVGAPPVGTIEDFGAYVLPDDRE